MNPGRLSPKVKIKEQFYRLLISDTIKLIITILVIFWLYNYFHNYFFTLIFTFNRTYIPSSWFLFENVLYMLFFLIFGFILGLIIEKRVLIKSFLAGIVLSLLILINFLRYNSIGTLFSSLEIHVYMFTPSLIFLACAFLMNISISHKKYIKMLKTVFSILIFIAFVGLVSEKSISYYQFYTSDAYRNTLDFEIPILTTAIDVKSWKSSKRGEKGLSYSFKTHNKSLEAFDFYNEFFIKNGFNVSQYSRSRDWIDAYETNIIDESDEPTLSIFFEDWVNKKLGIVASLKIVQSLATNSEAVIQKVALKVMPFTRKSEKWLETKGKIRDGGNQA